MQLVVFDFCETLVNFQSADRFVDYIIEKEKYHKYRWIFQLNRVLVRLRVLAVANKIWPELNPSKRLKLLQIKGISQSKIEQYAKGFYDEKVMPNLITPLYQLMQGHVNNGDYVMILSGGYAPYIKVFSEKHHLKAYFATEMAFEVGKLNGKFNGKDCLYAQKTVLLEQYLKDNPLTYTKKIAYSDSFSDLPLLQWADEAFVISKQKPQAWAKAYGFKEIIHD
jgi:HAD superfamily hydrolase (TIGR01490 family)